MLSIIDHGDRRCYLCGKNGKHLMNLEKHHIFRGPMRKVSEANGFTVNLCPNHHQYGPDAVHRNKKVDLMLKELCQREYEKTHTRQEFINLIGRNYIDDGNYNFSTSGVSHETD